MQGLVEILSKALEPFVRAAQYISNSKNPAIQLVDTTHPTGKTDVLSISAGDSPDTGVFSVVTSAGECTVTLGDFMKAMEALDHCKHQLKFRVASTRLIDPRSEAELIHRLITYEQTIKFYASQENWTTLDEVTSNMDPRSCPVAADRGQMARKALEGK